MLVLGIFAGMIIGIVLGITAGTQINDGLEKENEELKKQLNGGEEDV